LYRKPIDLPQAATQWADGVEGAPASLFLTGNIGVGKTHPAWHPARRWLDNQYRGGRPGSPTVQTWRSTQLFDARRPEGDDPRAVT
ncbi:hypothetical protein KBZ21_36240, partial [Streptomyces sp. A73]|nr:hypothetical protein [Streptomyces sp. A73]